MSVVDVAYDDANPPGYRSGHAALGPGVGADGAHQARNDSDAPARVLMWSEVVLPGVSAYPDSDEVGVWTGDPAGSLVVERSAAVPYFHGEAP